MCTGLICVAMLLVMSMGAKADLKMPAIFGDHMVLQQGANLPIWGWAAPGEKVTVTLAGQNAEAIAGADGKWLAKLNRVKAGAGGLELLVESSQGSRLTFRDVLMGEVWLCSGQSNMYWPVSGTFNAKEEGARANYPQIRFFKVAFKLAYEPQEDCEGKWLVCTPQTVQDFSAVGYYFGRDLHKALGCPVGLIQAACCATPAQAWTSLDGLRGQPSLNGFAAAFLKAQAQRDQIETEKARDIHIPTLLNNGMIAPLAPLAIQGVIWYQGESNMDNPGLYRTLFPALISDWRKKWAERGGPGDFAFLFAQLCSGAGDEVRFPLMREAQAAALALPRTGMAVIIDCGEPESPRIHPRNKRDVGSRLALLARRSVYGQHLIDSGPVWKAMQVEGNQIRLTFEPVDGGLVIGAPPQALEGKPANVPDTKLNGFVIAGPDRKFVPAQARIEGASVLVWAEPVGQPVAVRYAWRSGPFEANLYNKEGLPAAPFRTDTWER